MAFNCTVKFVGLCGFVPNRPIGLPSPYGADRMCAVLVDGSAADTQVVRAIDGFRLRRHVAFVMFDRKDVVGSAPNPKGKGIWYLEKQRVTIDAPGAPALQPIYTEGIDARLDVDAPLPGEEQDLAWVAGMNRIAPDFESMDRSAVTTAPPDSVIGQVIFSQGRLRAGLIEKQVWTVPKTLSAEILRRPLAHEVVLELAGITSLTFKAEALPGGQVDSLSLYADNNMTIEVTIANLCEENPLLWPKHSPVPKPDDDFRWYFQLLDQAQKGEIERRRRGASLPIPSPEMNRLGSAATGVNCFSTRFAPIGTGF